MNAFYTPSGNPGTGAAGLSALMRSEFAAIGTAFDLIPQITTTGAYSTIFNQVGDFAYTLPASAGTLAGLADVATATTRAEGAETVLTAAVSAETTARAAAVTAETARATAAEGVNAAAISAETTARTAAVSGETTRAEGAETVLTAAVSAETTARAAAVTAETTRATAAEGVNAAAIGAETTARAAAVSGEVTARNAAIAVETARAMAAETALATAAAADNVGRNLLLNGRFQIQQRGTGPFTTSGAYTADRWEMSFVGDTDSATVVTLADTDRTAIGDESAEYGLQLVVTGVNAAGDYSQIYQRILDARRISNKTVTISFWAKGSAALNLGAYLGQSFGSGGSPSANVVVAPTTFTLTTTWTRYQATVNMPSTAGKSFGTNLDSNTYLVMAMSSGSTNTALLGVGVQSGTWTVWGLQVEIGATATPLESRDIADELYRCQYFYALGKITWGGYLVSGSVDAGASLPRTMRTTPTVVLTAGFTINIASFSVVTSLITNQYVVAVGNLTTGNSATLLDVTYTASADL